MPNAAQKLFTPLYRAAHWPVMADYQRVLRRRALDEVFGRGEMLGPGPRVLEIGCGEGWVARWLADRGCRVLGVDLNPPRIKASGRADVVLAAGEAERLPVADRCADLVVSVGVLEHLPDRPAVLRELDRVLRPGGRMVHYVPGSASKVLQFLGFFPDQARKELRGLTRSLAGRRTARGDEAQRRQGGKEFHVGQETNNPRRASRRRGWNRRVWPRVHGEYDTHRQEFAESRRAFWEAEFDRAGYRVVRAAPLGLHSLYGFGFGRAAWASRRLGFATAWGFVIERYAADGAPPSTP